MGRLGRRKVYLLVLSGKDRGRQRKAGVYSVVDSIL